MSSKLKHSRNYLSGSYFAESLVNCEGKITDIPDQAFIFSAPHLEIEILNYLEHSKMRLSKS